MDFICVEVCFLLFFLFLYSEINFSSSTISECIQHSLWFTGKGKDSVVNDILKQAIFPVWLGVVC